MIEYADARSPIADGELPACQRGSVTWCLQSATTRGLGRERQERCARQAVWAVGSGQWGRRQERLHTHDCGWLRRRATISRIAARCFWVVVRVVAGLYGRKRCVEGLSLSMSSFKRLFFPYVRFVTDLGQRMDREPELRLELGFGLVWFAFGGSVQKILKSSNYEPIGTPRFTAQKKKLGR